MMPPVSLPEAERVGAWIVGGAGNVATTVAVGLAALARGLIEPVGLVTCAEPLAQLPLAPPGAFVLGGHELPGRDPRETARGLAAERVFREDLVCATAPELARYCEELRPGIDGACGAAELARVRADLASFRERHRLARVVVLHLATTEAAVALPTTSDPDELLAAITRDTAKLPASALYAAAALDLGMGYVNFTPSVGAGLPALEELARRRGAPHAGADGKTGETLVKTALAPMFAIRELRVTSWFGQNVLGNADGAALADPARRDAKRKTKGAALGEILGYEPDADVGISYLRAFGDWKVAWDHIAFEGFGGARMAMQFTWQGCDSALAAPLCIDLLRLVELAQRRGERGALPWLAMFFKAPVGTREHRLEAQHRMLLEHLLGDKAQHRMPLEHLLGDKA